MMRSVISLLLLLHSTHIASALRINVNENLPWDKILRASESYMFSSENGPAIMEQGESYIELDTSVVISMKENRTTTVKYAIYTCDEINSQTEITDRCGSELLEHNPWMDNVSIFSFF